MSEQNVWQPPEQSGWTPAEQTGWQPGEPWPAPMQRRSHVVLWATLAGVILLVAVGVAALAVAVGNSVERRPLPRNAAEALAWEGQRITVETGVTPDHRDFTVEVSVNKFGEYCDFVTVTTKGGAGGGGGGCGSSGPLGLEFSSNGSVHGLTSERVATVEIVTPTGRVTVFTKPLPVEFKGHRYYLAVFASGTQPTELIARAVDGSVVTKKRVESFGR